LRDGEFRTATKLLDQGEFEILVDVAVNNQDDEIFQILTEFKIISYANRDGLRLALAAASRHGREALVHLLLDKCGPYYAGDDAVFSGQPLLEAVGNDHETTVRILLDNGTDICTPPCL
jgi:hypothetical protein